MALFLLCLASKERLRREAETVLQQLEGRYRAYALFLLFDADTDGDDILVGAGKRIPCLRQQEKGSGYRCLADFVSSRHEPPFSQIGVFATSVDHGLETDFDAKGEHLSIPEMLLEKFQGIRPAVGYPSLPDTSLNFVLDELLDMKQIGIRLTESGAMKPHASVSGLMLAHPQAHYFNLGKIGEDYAHRRGLPVEICRKFLASNM